MRTLVIGVGNLLRTDDGVGIHIINRLSKLHPEIDTFDAAMGSIEILEAMRGYERVVIVDSIETGVEPGTIYRVNLASGEKPLVISHSHGTDVLTILELGRLLYGEWMPKEIILMAIEAEDTITIGDKLTSRVCKAMDEVLQKILEHAK
jgi:hydrogenase maturation protease